MALTSGTRLGVYEVTAQIGEGGMGQVYRARDTQLNRDVALKVLPEAFAGDADRLARFTREAQVLASLTRPAPGSRTSSSSASSQTSPRASPGGCGRCVADHGSRRFAALTAGLCPPARSSARMLMGRYDHLPIYRAAFDLGETGRRPGVIAERRLVSRWSGRAVQRDESPQQRSEVEGGLERQASLGHPPSVRFGPT